ncbi:MAG TPA: type II secretion system inner membrane protein GspF [Gammaproteobacteria bacterium]|jgi:general secretion pathway protein F|nr:type II secretion system inner membrane protein GspF [Gammaproteobacteria bacterium]
MGAYQYVAVDPGGKEHRGVLEGDTPRHVRQLLRERQLFPVEVAEVEHRERIAQRQISLRRGISGLDLALLTRQLATLVRAGLPLEEALLAVSEHTEKPRLKSIILGVRAKVLEGHSLAVGLEDFPHAFPTVYRATVSAGEQAGQLDTVLERLAEYTESRHALRQKILQAMIYPVVLTAISFGIVTLMLVVVVPKVVTVFETTGVQLPLLTRGLIAFSGLIQHWWFLIIGAAALAIFAARRALRNEATRRKVHRWMLRTPVLGRVVRGLNTARFTRTLSILTASGVPALEALRISASVILNIPMREAVDEAAVRVREGGAIGRSLAQSKLFPAMSIHLISSGEASGELDAMLDRAATHQESEMDSLLSTMLSVLEPLLIVVMGLMVLTIVMAILLPIFQINQLVK